METKRKRTTYNVKRGGSRVINSKTPKDDKQDYGKKK